MSSKRTLAKLGKSPIWQRGFVRGMRRAAEIANMYADENMRMANDTVAMDPILNSRLWALLKSQRDVDRAAVLSAKLADDGHAFASRSHAAQDIHDAILAEIE